LDSLQYNSTKSRNLYLSTNKVPSYPGIGITKEFYKMKRFTLAMFPICNESALLPWKTVVGAGQSWGAKLD